LLQVGGFMKEVIDLIQQGYHIFTQETAGENDIIESLINMNYSFTIVIKIIEDDV
jgi:hypothetical protein